MPKRWLSICGHKESKDVANVTQDQFDFEFVTSPQARGSPSTPTKPKNIVFNGPSFRSKHSKQDLFQPQLLTTSKLPVDKRLQLTKVEDNWIGVAFGSPTHPPANMPSFSGDESSPSSKYGSSLDGPSPAPASYMSKYKKFGNLFKSKPAQLSISAPTKVYRIDGDQVFDMPIATKPWQGPNSPLDWINSENPEAFTTSLAGALDDSKWSNTSTTPLRPLRSGLPKLELQIPDMSMERYSVMFSEVPGLRPSLLQRRSRNLSNLELGTTVPSTLPVVAPLKPVQADRPTTPTHHRRTSSTYSLFPSPPKSKSITEENLDYRLPRRQSSISSNEIQLPKRQPSVSSRTLTSSNKASFPSVDELVLQPERLRPTPDRKVSDPFSISPDETIASSEREDSPWGTESLPSTPSSRTSIGSEIFFDLRPVHDSEGRAQSQYIIQNADSSAIELAISKSRKARKARDKEREDHKATFTMSPDLQAAEYMLKVEEKWSLSMKLNQAIEDVERLTSPLSTLLPILPASKYTAPSVKPAPKELLPSIKLRRQLSGALIGIPSPITERSEEFSPRLSSPRSKLATTITTTTTRRAVPRQHIASLSIRPAPLNISNESLFTTSTEFSFAGITPPPVLVKDAKFIPISRFAGPSNKTGSLPAVKLVELRPPQPRPRRKPKRSATESNITFTTEISSFPAPPSHSRSNSTSSTSRSRERSTTVSKPPIQTTTRPQRSHKPSLSANNIKALTHQQQQSLLSPTTTQRIEAGILALTVPPTAEVSVARTISLERTISQAVVVYSPTISTNAPTTATRKPGKESFSRPYGHSRGTASHSRSGSRGRARNGNGSGSGNMLGNGPMLSPVRCMSPNICEGAKSHKVGVSLDFVVER